MPYFLTICFRAVKSLFSFRLLKIFILSAICNALFLGLYVLLAYFTLSKIFGMALLSEYVGLGTAIIAFGAAYFVYPMTLPLIIYFFAAAIVRAIEAKEYADIPTSEPPYWPSLGHDVLFVLKAIFLNILALPLYLVPGLNMVLYYVLNGFLIGTEFFNIVAGRHIDRAQAYQLRRDHRWPIVASGTLTVFLSTVPVLNLIAPLIGVAMMVHLFHALKPAYRSHPLALPEQ